MTGNRILYKALVVITLVSLTACGGGGATTPIDPVYLGDPSVNTGEQDMIDRHNTTRTTGGLTAFTVNQTLCEVAQNQANYQAQTGQLTHQDASGDGVDVRATNAGYSWTSIGENVGYDTDSQQLYTNWLNSSGHHANIVNPSFVEIGIGRAQRGIYYYWSVVFGSQ